MRRSITLEPDKSLQELLKQLFLLLFSRLRKNP